MTASKLIDTSVWLDYFLKNKYKEHIDTPQILFTSVLSIFEIKRKFYKEKMNQNEIDIAMKFVVQKSIIFSLTTEIADNAALLSHEKNLAAVDALIYATAQEHNAQLLTCDNDFRGLNNVTILN